MLQKTLRTYTTNTIGRLSLPHVFILLGLTCMLILACGVESGNRRPARQDEDKTGEFHRSPVAAFEQFRVNLEKTDTGCTADPADITVGEDSRVNFAPQLTGGGVTTTATGSTQLQGEREKVTYKVDGLVISESAGAFGAGVTEIDMELVTGARLSYSFKVGSAGAFDILCDGEKIGTFTVN